MSNLKALQRAFGGNPLTSAFGDVLAGEGTLTHISLEQSPSPRPDIDVTIEDDALGAVARERLGALLLSHLLGAPDRAVFVIDAETDRDVPWYARFGLDTPHLFVGGQLVAYFGREHRPSAAQVAALLALENRPSALLGLVTAIDPVLFDYEGEDLTMEAWHAHLSTPKMLFASLATGRETPRGFVSLELVD